MSPRIPGSTEEKRWTHNTRCYNPTMYQDTRDIYCEACGYNLHDKRSGECPECGASFDHAKGLGYRNTPANPTWQWLLRNGSLIGAFVCFGLCFSSVMIYLYSPNRMMLLAIFAMAGTGFIEILHYYSQSHKRKGRP